MGNGLQELSARTVLSKHSILLSQASPPPPLPPPPLRIPLSFSQKQQIRSIPPVFSERIYSCTGEIHVNQELSVYRFFNHTENEKFMAIIHTNI